MPKLNINEGFDKLYNHKCVDVLRTELDGNYDDDVHEDNLEECADNLFKSIDENTQDIACNSKCYEMYLDRLNRFKDNKEQLELDLKDIEELAYKQMSSEETEDLRNMYKLYISKLDEAFNFNVPQDKESIKRILHDLPTLQQLTPEQRKKIADSVKNKPKLTKEMQDELGDDRDYIDAYAEDIAKWQLKNYGFVWKI